MRGLKVGIAGGLLVMRAEDLKEWLRESKHNKYPVRRIWELFVRIIHLEFEGGTLLEELTWMKMVLLPKLKEGYWVIWLVEVMWKVCTVVANCCLKRSVQLHGMPHCFKEGQVTGTATLEANMVQHLAVLAHRPLLRVFMDVS